MRVHFLMWFLSCAPLREELFSGRVPVTSSWENVYAFTSSLGSGLSFKCIPVFVTLCHADGINAGPRPTHSKVWIDCSRQIVFFLLYSTQIPGQTASFLINSPGRGAKVFNPFFVVSQPLKLHGKTLSQSPMAPRVVGMHSYRHV